MARRVNVFQLMISFFITQFMLSRIGLFLLMNKLSLSRFIAALLVKYIVPNDTELQDEILDQGMLR